MNLRSLIRSTTLLVTTILALLLAGCGGGNGSGGTPMGGTGGGHAMGTSATRAIDEEGAKAEEGSDSATPTAESRGAGSDGSVSEARPAGQPVSEKAANTNEAQ